MSSRRTVGPVHGLPLQKGPFRRLVGPLVMLLVFGALSCAPRSAPSDGAAREVSRRAGSRAITALAPSQKRSVIASSFPAEVPVARGVVVRARAQGESAWDYEIEVDADPGRVLTWYQDAYLGRQWVVVGSGGLDGGAGGFLDFRKNRAESSVRVYPIDDGSRSRVVVTVGIGTPVLEVQ